MFIDIHQLPGGDGDELNLDLSIFDRIKHDEDVFIFDITEANRLWPLEESDYPVIYNISKKIENKKNNFYYICSVCNIHKKYEEWVKKIKPKKKLIPLYYPFFITESWNKFSKQCETIEYLIRDIEIKKNFICLVSAPKIFRIILLDNFYKNKNFEYSFYPYHHILDQSNDYFFGKREVITPYQWDKSGNSILFDSGMISVNYSISTKKENCFNNGFNLHKNIKKLTEFDFFDDCSNIDFSKFNTVSLLNIDKKIKEKFYEKNTFNNLIPIESFYTNVDLICESYVNDSVFFTEKIWKSIFFKRPFIVFGSQNYHQTLRKLGFELYDEIFDYSFDHEKNVRDRYHKFVKEIERHIDKDPISFKKELEVIQNKIVKNFNLLQSKIKESIYLREIIQDNVDVNKIKKIFEKYENNL